MKDKISWRGAVYYLDNPHPDGEGWYSYSTKSGGSIEVHPTEGVRPA